MNKKQLREYIDEETDSGKLISTKHPHMVGILYDGTPYQIDKMPYTKEKYIVTLFGHKKPQFKIGNKTFIVS